MKKIKITIYIAFFWVYKIKTNKKQQFIIRSNIMCNVDIRVFIEMEQDEEFIEQEVTLNVEYEEIIAQPDVGIYHNYIEVDDITIDDEDFKKNMDVLNYIEENQGYIGHLAQKEVLGY